MPNHEPPGRVEVINPVVWDGSGNLGGGNAIYRRKSEAR